MKNMIKIVLLAVVISSFAACDPAKKTKEKTVIDTTKIDSGKIDSVKVDSTKIDTLKK